MALSKLDLLLNLFNLVIARFHKEGISKEGIEALKEVYDQIIEIDPKKSEIWLKVFDCPGVLLPGVKI